MTEAQHIVCYSGLLLFVLGLLHGLIIPKTRSPRLSLSGHLTAVQCGTFLIAISWAWPQFGLTASTSLLAAWALGGSMFILWVAFLVAGIVGAGQSLPISGQGAHAAPVQQHIVTALLGMGVIGTTGSCLFLLIAW
jgi:(hydroxyamino)benzene mutase